MKKIFNVSILLIVLMFTVSVFAEDGDMGAGNKNCTSNCLVSGEPVTTVVKKDDTKEISVLSDFYIWVNKQLFDIFD